MRSRIAVTSLHSSITVSHAIVDGRGAFLILDALVRSLHVRASDTYLWDEAESRLAVSNALLAGARRIGEPPSEAAQAFGRDRAARQIAPAKQVLLPTLAPGSVGGVLRAVSRSLDSTQSGRLFAAAKAHSTTVTAASA